MSDAPSETIQPTSDSTPLIFISHSHKDEANVHRIYDWLCRFGFRCWVSFVDLVENEQYRVISRKIEECDLFLLVWSKDSLESHEVATEITKAHKLRKKFIIYQLDLAKPDHNIDMFIAYKEFRVLPGGDEFSRLEMLITQILIESGAEKQAAQDKANIFVEGAKSEYAVNLADWQDHYWERRYDISEGRTRTLTRLDEAALLSMAEVSSISEEDICTIKSSYTRDFRTFYNFLRSFIGRARRGFQISQVDLDLLEQQRTKSCISRSEAMLRTEQLLDRLSQKHSLNIQMNIDIEQLSAKWLIQVLLSKKTLTQTDDITVIMNDIASDDVHEQNQSLQNDRKLCDAESLCVITPTNPKTPVELNDLEASLLPSTDASVAVASDSDCTDNPSVNSTQYSIGFKKGLAPVDFIFGDVRLSTRAFRRLSLAPDYLTLSRYESYEETESFKVGSLWAGSRFLGYGTSDKDGTPSSIAEPIRHIVVYSTCIVLCLFDAGNIFRIETDTSNTNHAALMHIIKHIGVPIVFIPKADNIAEELSLSSTSENPWTDTRVSTPDTTKSKDTILTEQQNRRIENDDIVDERTYSLANESTNKEQEDTEFIFWSIVFSVAAVSAWLLYLFASTALSLGWHVLEFFFRKGLSLS